MGAFLFAPHHRQPTDRRTSRPETARRRFRRQLTGRSRRQSRGPERPSRPGQRPAKHTARPADQPPDPARSRDTTSNSKHKSTTVYQNERGAGTRQRAGHPPRFALAGRGTGRQGPRLWAACRPARGLPWPCRPGKRPALPPAGGVPRAPPRANARGGGACAASARGGLNCGPPQRREPNDRRKPGESQPPAGGRAPEGRLGASGRSPEARAPKGRYAGRRVRRQSRAARPAPQAWPGWQGWPKRRRPGRRGGRPQSPHEWGPGRPGAPAPRPARGRSNARPGLRPAPQGLGLALRRGAPAQRLAANLTRTRRRRGLGRHISPARPRRGLDGAGGGTAAAQGGQGVGPQAGGAGGTWPARRRDADGSPFPQAARPPERTKKGVPTGHSLLFWLIKADRPASQTAGGSPPPPLGKVHFIGNFRLSRGDNTGALPLYPASRHIRRKPGVINSRVLYGHAPLVQQVG